MKLGLENRIGNPWDVLKFVRKRGSVKKKEEKDAKMFGIQSLKLRYSQIF